MSSDLAFSLLLPPRQECQNSILQEIANADKTCKWVLVSDTQRIFFSLKQSSFPQAQNKSFPDGLQSNLYMLGALRFAMCNNIFKIGVTLLTLYSSTNI